MDPPGRVNNLYKERMVIEPEYEIKPIVDETSQGCKYARTAGYGTLEYCTQPSDPINIPPRYFQFDENITRKIESKNETQILPWIVLVIVLLLIWRS